MARQTLTVQGYRHAPNTIGAAFEPLKLTVPHAVKLVSGYVPSANLTVTPPESAARTAAATAWFCSWRAAATFLTAPAQDASGAAAVPEAVSLPPGAT